MEKFFKNELGKNKKLNGRCKSNLPLSILLLKVMDRAIQSKNQSFQTK